MGFEENREGVVGWLRVKGYSLEKLLYLLHRATGIGLVVYLFWHLIYIGQRLGGWGDVFLGVLLLFHGVNGIRLILAEYGLVLGKPYRPVYPYRRGSIYGKQRAIAVAALAIFLLLLYFWSYVALYVVGA